MTGRDTGIPIPGTDSNFSTVAFMVILATIANSVTQVQKGRSPAPVLVGNLFLLVALNITSDLTGNDDLAEGLALVYLLGSFLTNGARLINSVVAIVNGVSGTVKK